MIKCLANAISKATIYANLKGYGSAFQLGSLGFFRSEWAVLQKIRGCSTAPLLERSRAVFGPCRCRHRAGKELHNQCSVSGKVRPEPEKAAARVFARSDRVKLIYQQMHKHK